MTYQDYVRQFNATNTAGRGARPMSEADWNAKNNPQTAVMQTPTTATPATPVTGISGQAAPLGTLQSEIDKALMAGAHGAQQGGNTQQVQGSTQAGAFQTAGTQNQTESQTQAQQQTGTSAQSQTSETGVKDTLGLGQLLQRAAEGVGATDAARTNFLEGVLQMGDPRLQEQTRGAVNAALSGPGMQGVGDNARARAAGHAATGVANSSLAGQLNAAQQLAGPSATTNLVAAGNPFLGQTTTGTTLGQTQNTTLGTALSNLVNKESQAGTSSANSTQVAAGNTPQQQIQSGGSIICTALVYHGLLPRTVVASELSWISAHWLDFRRAAIGYYFLGRRPAVWSLHSVTFARFCRPLAYWCSYEASRKQNQDKPFKFRGWLAYHTFFAFCDKVGWLLETFFPKHAKDVIIQPELVNLLKTQNLELKCSLS